MQIDDAVVKAGMYFTDNVDGKNESFEGQRFNSRTKERFQSQEYSLLNLVQWCAAFAFDDEVGDALYTLLMFYEPSSSELEPTPLEAQIAQSVVQSTIARRRIPSTTSSSDSEDEVSPWALIGGGCFLVGIMVVGWFAGWSLDATALVIALAGIGLIVWGVIDLRR